MNLIHCIAILVMIASFDFPEVDAKKIRRVRIRIIITRGGIDIDVDIERQRRAISQADFEDVQQEIRDITHQGRWIGASIMKFCKTG